MGGGLTHNFPERIMSDGNLTTKLPSSFQLVLLIARGEIKYLPPLPLVFKFVKRKNIQKENLKHMVFVAMMATSLDIIQGHFHRRDRRVSELLFFKQCAGPWEIDLKALTSQAAAYT